MMTREELKKLRSEIRLGSLFTNDFKNSFGIEPRACQDFFDGYADYLGELIEEAGYKNSEYWTVIDQFDNEETLFDWYNCIENNPF